jgi:hypothetical protein
MPYHYEYSWSSQINSYSEKDNWYRSWRSDERWVTRFTDDIYFTIAIELEVPDAHNDLFQRVDQLLGKHIRSEIGKQAVWSGKTIISWARYFPYKCSFNNKCVRPALGKAEHMYGYGDLTGPLMPPYNYKITHFMTKTFRCPRCTAIPPIAAKFCTNCQYPLVPSWPVPATEGKTTEPKSIFAGIPDSLRSRHVYVPGASQHGKSTFIENMAITDMMNNHGVGILDPKGDLIKSILHKIPSHRRDDVILLETKNPVPIDIMGWTNDQEKETLASDIFDTFLAFSTMTAGDQWQSILQAVLTTLLEAKGCSFLDINTILVNPEKRKAILDRVKNQNILDYWEHEFPLLKKDAAQPILTRMKKFMFSPALSKLLGCADAPLDIFELMEKKKILLVDLTGVGKGNGRQVGQLIVSKIQQSVMRREDQRREDRIPFHLYCDEFQNFLTSAFDTILSEAGGYKLYLTLANQGLYQLKQNSQVMDAIFTNVTGAWVVFRLDERDVSNFKLKALPMDSKRLASIPPHQAFIKIGNDPPAILPTPPPVIGEEISRAQYIRERTLSAYACKSDQKTHTSDNGKSDRRHEVEKPPQKETGRPPVPPVRTRQGNS